MKAIVGHPAGVLSVVTSFAAVILFGASAGWAQQPGFARNILQKVDSSAPGRELVQITAEFAAGAATGMHTHPGEEVGYVLEGGPFTLTIKGKPPMTLKAGDHFFVPAGTVHEGKNSGIGKAKVLVTYIVEKGKPLATPVK
jgi:quercetin dioxygenase-like cupin family protein